MTMPRITAQSPACVTAVLPHHSHGTQAPRPNLIESLIGYANDAASDYRLADSRDAWLQVWESSSSRAAACNIGELSLRIGDATTAAAYLSTCVHGLPGEDATVEKEHLRSLATARRSVGSLTIDTRQGVSITIDGHAIGTAPLPGDVFVTAGSHHVYAELSGAVGEIDVNVQAGEARTVALPLTPRAQYSIVDSPVRAVSPLVIAMAVVLLSIAAFTIGFRSGRVHS